MQGGFMSIIEEYLYIDYENVQDVNISIIKNTMKVRIIVGENQTKVPVALIQKTQPLGTSVEWIQVSGKGKNALDFFIAFYLGQDIEQNRGKSFIIYSKDTGYDPLINHLKKNNIKARRIVSFQELSQHQTIIVNEPEIQKVKDNLRKIAANKRPKKRNSFTKYLTSIFNGTSAQNIEKILEDLFIKKIVYEENGIIKYALDQ